MPFRQSEVRSPGFTLIELLIVVLIVAILAAIALPNFLEFQVRAKLARAKSDLRNIATALEAYGVDEGVYPLCNPYSNSLCYSGYPRNELTFERLTSPIAYLGSEASFADPFPTMGRYYGYYLDDFDDESQPANGDQRRALMAYKYQSRDATTMARWQDATLAKWWLIECVGPDGTYHNLATLLNNMQTESALWRGRACKALYDPTNGTVSRGSVFRVGGTPQATGAAFFHLVDGRN